MKFAQFNLKAFLKPTSAEELDKGRDGADSISPMVALTGALTGAFNADPIWHSYWHFCFLFAYGSRAGGVVDTDICNRVSTTLPSGCLKVDETIPAW